MKAIIIFPIWLLAMLWIELSFRLSYRNVKEVE